VEDVYGDLDVHLLLYVLDNIILNVNIC